MRTLAVLSQKGGAGKTSTSVHLAVAAWKELNLKAGGTLAQDAVRVLDTDPQKTAMNSWYARRVKKQGLAAPQVDAIEVRDLKATLDAARSNGTKLAIIDTRPNAGPDSVDVAALADLVVIPIKPETFDIDAAMSTIEIVRQAGTPGLIVLYACKYRAPETKFARSALAKLGLPIATTEIGDRRSFGRAVQSGRAVNEFEENGKAAEEIRSLLKEVW